jgi:hypothetical protein
LSPSTSIKRVELRRTVGEEVDHSREVPRRQLLVARKAWTPCDLLPRDEMSEVDIRAFEPACIGLCRWRHSRVNGEDVR